MDYTVDVHNVQGMICFISCSNQINTIPLLILFKDESYLNLSLKKQKSFGTILLPSFLQKILLMIDISSINHSYCNI